MSLTPPERSEVIAWGVAECVTVFLLFLFVLVERLKAEKMFALRSKADKTAFHLLGAWIGVCVASAGIGILRGNQWDYVLGDFYRFASLAIVLTLMYFAVKDSAWANRLLYGFVGVYGVMVALDLLRFNSYVYDGEERLTTETAHQAGLIATAVIYLILFDSRRWVRRSSIVLLLLMLMLMLRAQMLTPIITSLLAVALFFCFNRKFALFLACGAVGVVILAATFYFWTGAAQGPSYIEEKFQNAQDKEGPFESLEALSGVRLGEIISIGEEIGSNPSNWLFGVGSGGLLTPDPILPIARFEMDKHYIHAGLFEILYRTGILGVGSILLFLLQLFRRARRLYASGDPFGLFVMVALMVAVMLLVYDLPFESAVPMIAFCFCGLSSMEFRPKFAPKPVRLKSLTHFHAGLPQAAGQKVL
jgi:hypothetical protein